MADLTWRRPDQSSTLWSAVVHPSPARQDSATAQALASSLPHRCPSGINGFSTSKNDHIALFVVDDDETNSYLNIILDYISAGVTSGTANEILSLELTKNQPVSSAEVRLESLLGKELPNTIDIRGWDRNASDYTAEHFDRLGMWRAMTAERARLQSVTNPMLRVASADCTAFMQWLTNPLEYIEYEHELGDDLSRILDGQPFIQLCVFKVLTLHEIAAHNHFDAQAALLDLALSHNRILLLERGDLHSDRAAERQLLKVTFPPKTRAARARWLRIAARSYGPTKLARYLSTTGWSAIVRPEQTRSTDADVTRNHDRMPDEASSALTDESSQSRAARHTRRRRTKRQSNNH